MPEYLDPSIAGEGESANNWQPGAWASPVADAGEEYQPDIEPPHIPDYAMLKKHKHYKQYFRPYRYQPFPSWMYHATLEPKIVKTREEVIALGPDWSHVPLKPRIDMTGKTLPVKSDTQRLTEALVAGLVKQQPQGAPVDATAIAAIVAAVMAATQQQSVPARAAAPDLAALMPKVEIPQVDAAEVGDATERAALIELADKEGVKVEAGWSNQRLKEALGL